MVQGSFKWSFRCPLLRGQQGWQRTNKKNHIYYPSQIPNHFKIVPLPNKITSWLIALMHKLPMNQQFKETHPRSKLGHGEDGEGTTKSSEMATSSSNPSPDTSKSSLLELLPWLCVKDSFQDQRMINWLKAESLVPFNMYVWPSEKMATQTFSLMKMPDLASFYNNSIGPTEMQTQQKNTKNQSQCVSWPRWEKIQFWTLCCNVPTCMPQTLICMSIMQISQSPSIGAKTNSNPLP